MTSIADLLQSNDTTVRMYMRETKRKRQRANRKYYPTAIERDDIIANLGEPAYILYAFYLGRQKDFNYRDATVQKTFHYWSIRKIAETRKKLEKAGYINTKIFPGRPKQGLRTIVVTTLGNGT